MRTLIETHGAYLVPSLVVIAYLVVALAVHLRRHAALTRPALTSLNLSGREITR